MYHSESSENCCFSCFNLQLFIIYHSLLYCFPIIHLDGLFPFCVLFFCLLLLSCSIRLLTELLSYVLFFLSIFLSMCVWFHVLLRCCNTPFVVFVFFLPSAVTVRFQQQQTLEKKQQISYAFINNINTFTISSRCFFFALLGKTQFSPHGVATSTSSCFLHSPRAQFSRRSTLTDW